MNVALNLNYKYEKSLLYEIIGYYVSINLQILTSHIMFLYNNVACYTQLEGNIELWTASKLFPPFPDSLQIVSHSWLAKRACV